MYSWQFPPFSKIKVEQEEALHLLNSLALAIPSGVDRVFLQYLHHKYNNHNLKELEVVKL